MLNQKISKTSKIFIALPLMDELETVQSVMDSLCEQKVSNPVEVFVCVNQPDEWWDDEEKRLVCKNNMRTIRLLENGFTGSKISLTIIDRFSPGSGWKGKQHGVGWARKTVMDAIDKVAYGSDIIVSLDGDTTFGEHYLQSIADNIASNIHATAIAVPYYHKLTGDELTDRCILRYEIYMRHYALNLWRIKSPYHFTALGSAMAIPVWAYRSIGGMTPQKSGEDFYLLQKLCKMGDVLTWNKEKVYPAARFSDRVFFGTGPAMIKGRDGDWSSYPVYDYRLFDEVLETYNSFEQLFIKDIPTPMTAILSEQHKKDTLWEPLRKNVVTKERFIRACHQKVDGLRVLQYLKSRQNETEHNDEQNLLEYFERFYPEESKTLNIDFKQFSFKDSPVEELDRIRDFMVAEEEKCQKNTNY
jgi:hypothetical protein